MNINIKTIPNKEQRYNTLGDYFDNENGTNIFVSDLGNEDYEFLIGLHELVEQYLCKKRGIKEEDISKFDIKFEKERKDGDDSEPGDNKNAPYRKEHFIATNIERIICGELGLNWQDYEDACLNIE
jgi:hypothetical protein